ncbi:MAG: hypothetical protein C4524_10015 [Candidatus Zixiibacteriota bacterium]|nr:MAG: hypothetical protein C4524_10015 [candidate division Zixibacteria bacterium]
MSGLTPHQTQAVISDDAFLVVRAGAGSGKTRVLVERYLRLVLEQGLSPRRILAATFTEKAAAEMKERVARELESRGEAERVAELNAAPVCTLHGFCSRLIAPHALELGLDPGFRILDDLEATLLQEEILTGVLARLRRDRPADLEAIVARLHWPGDFQPRRGLSPASRGFSRQFLDLVEAARCAGRGTGAPFLPLSDDPAAILAQAESLRAELAAALARMAADCSPGSQEKARLALSALERLARLPHLRHPETMQTCRELEGIRLNVCEELKSALRRVKEDLVPLLWDAFFAGDYDAVRLPLNALYQDYLQAYHARKLEQGALDFLDLEERALEILARPGLPPPVDCVLIDEAQDLNRVQWEILNRLAERAPLFIVGDVQQSIYGFRYADVDLFARAARRAREGEGKEILLEENWRSRASVLGTVNPLFLRLWQGNEEAPFLELKPSYPYPSGSDEMVELLLADGPDRAQAREAEARFLARRLEELVKGGMFRVCEEIPSDSGPPEVRFRPPAWGDVLVLVRAGSSFDPLERAFREREIPFLIQAGRGFWDALEINDFMVLLRSLEDPGDNFSLACLLVSPGVGFSCDDLLELRRYPLAAAAGEPRWETRPLFEGLTALRDSAAPGTDLPARAARFLDLFTRLYEAKDRLPLRRLLQIWIQETGLEAHWASLPDGRLKAVNVRKFLRLCDARAGEPLARLRAAFEEIRLREVREASAPDPQSGEGAVQVMTVHGAKGLEAPLVALFDLNYAPRSSGGAFTVRADGAAAFGLQSPQPGGKPFQPFLFQAMHQEAKVRRQSEDQRVLYVALTRAREKLLLTASGSEGEKGYRAAGWFKLILDHLRLEANDIFDAARVPEGPLPLFDAAGAPAGLRLLRAPDGPPAPLPRRGPAAIPAAPEEAPAGFPAPPAPGRRPVSVTEHLWGAHASLPASGVIPFEFRISEDGSLLTDESAEGGLALGLWVHRLLQVLPPDADSRRVEEAARREALPLFGRPPDPALLAEAVRLVNTFLRSPLGGDLRQARRAVREYPLLFEVDGLLLRGSLDLAFQRDDGWVLVDYKSDRRPLALSPERLAAYRAQLAFYARGWEGLTGTLPREALLFFLHTGVVEAIPMETAELERLCRQGLP